MAEWTEAKVTDFGLPRLDPDEYMVGVMMDLGPCRENGMSESATDWNIITPYTQAIGLDAEDTVLLAEMCKAYHRERQVGVNPLAIEPADRAT